MERVMVLVDMTEDGSGLSRVEPELGCEWVAMGLDIVELGRNRAVMGSRRGYKPFYLRFVETLVELGVPSNGSVLGCNGVCGAV